jgi:hypothetical protein
MRYVVEGYCMGYISSRQSRGRDGGGGSGGANGCPYSAGRRRSCGLSVLASSDSAGLKGNRIEGERLVVGNLPFLGHESVVMVERSLLGSRGIAFLVSGIVADR